MRFYIDIELENDAFKPSCRAELLARLHDVIEDLRTADVTQVGAFPLRDSNGNTCGVAGFARGRVRRLQPSSR